MPDFTLSVTSNDAQRIAVAFGRYWHLKDAQDHPRNATAAEVKEYLIRQLKGVVVQQERAQAEAALPAAGALSIV